MRQIVRSDQNGATKNENDSKRDENRDFRRNVRQKDAEGRKVKGRGALVRFKLLI